MNRLTPRQIRNDLHNPHREVKRNPSTYKAGLIDIHSEAVAEVNAVLGDHSPTVTS